MLRKRRWQMVLLLFIAGIINYLDRSALSVAAPLVSKDLGLSPADLGLIFSSFFLGYALFNFVGGWAADRIGGRLSSPSRWRCGRCSAASPPWRPASPRCSSSG